MRARGIILFAALALAACSNPGLYAGVGFGPKGVSITPAASARVGGATVTVRP